MDSLILQKIEASREKYAMLSEELGAGFSSVDKLKEFSKLAAVIEMADKYNYYKKSIEDTRELLGMSLNDPELAAMCTEDLEKYIDALKNLDADLVDAFIDKDPEDAYNAIFEIAGEVGGEEANLFARDLYEMYVRFAEKSGYKLELIDAQETDLGGYNYISFKVIGEDAYGVFKYESGVHRVQRVPETEAKGRLHTSTASVMVIPEVSADKLEIDINDIEFVPCHSQGKGGQNVNKVSSAIRATHKPTGLVVFCQGERSQLQNKEQAIKMIASKLKSNKAAAEAEASSLNKASKLGTRDRSEKIRTYNYPQNRVTDHRINFSVLKLDRVMSGDLDDIIRALHIEANNEQIK